MFFVDIKTLDISKLNELIDKGERFHAGDRETECDGIWETDEAFWGVGEVEVKSYE